MPSGIYPRKLIDHVGEVHGRLTVEKFSHRDWQYFSYWKCKCECGRVCVVRHSSLKNKHTRSCGCLNVELSTKRVVHYNTLHGDSGTRLHGLWCGIIGRCSDKMNPLYGKRGITVCKAWHTYDNFRKWVLSCKNYSEELSIERKDVNGPYSPRNCTWATKKEQARNRRDSVYVRAFGEKLHINEWSERLDIKAATLRHRRRRNPSPKYVLKELFCDKKEIQ